MAGGPHTLFVSDLHLDDSRPAATDLFLRYLSGPARAAEALYVLGDLFEYWLGDDVSTPASEQVCAALRALADAGVPCHFMHGNRDFLLGEAYADRCGMRLLEEETLIDLYGEPTLLLHGDQLCTDDTAYQAARSMVRDPAWKAEFLSRSPQARADFARDARRRSRRHKGAVSEDIMDVNPSAVAAAFARHGVRRMIHGHTHRPAVHAVDLPTGEAERIVLGDWYEQGSALRVARGRADLETLAFKN